MCTVGPYGSLGSWTRLLRAGFISRPAPMRMMRRTRRTPRSQSMPVLWVILPPPPLFAGLEMGLAGAGCAGSVCATVGRVGVGLLGGRMTSPTRPGDAGPVGVGVFFGFVFGPTGLVRCVERRVFGVGTSVAAGA